ncbi:MAG: hypothetical protein Q8S24_06870 [Eubacteriales bacterium]|nr:hypothetical protein [Eubacteriales bacterium]
MNIHKFVDNFSMGIAGKTVKKKYFSKNVSSKKVKDWIEVLKLEIPSITKEGHHRIKVEYDGCINEAGIHVEQWKGSEYPTIIYHHGAAEGSYDFSFKRILTKDKSDIKANLIGIQALFNHNNKEFMDSISDLSNYTAMLATSMMMVEQIIKNLRQTSDIKVIVTGTSLGGFVTNLHFTYFGTADVYVPLMAGARIGDALVDSAYGNVMSEYGKSNSERVINTLNFDKDFKHRDQKNLFPLLALHDQIVRYSVQSKDYNADKIHTIPYGHSTGATRYKLLQRHILNHIV